MAGHSFCLSGLAHLLVQARCTATVAAVLAILSVPTMVAQPHLSLQGAYAGPALNFLSLIVEAPVVTFDTGVSQSIRASVAYGIPWTNAQYVPIFANYIMFRGNGHLEVFGGVALQIAWRARTEEERLTPWSREIASSAANPAFGLGYRYEKPTGGFVFRIGLSALYIAADHQPWMPSMHLCFGHSF